MLIYFCSLFLIFSGDPVVIRETGVFYPLTRNDVRVAWDGSVFILDSSEQVVKRFDAEGRAQGIVGGRGEGPGEYTSAWAIYMDGDHFYIRDRRSRKIIVYNLKGQFLRNIPEPSDGFDITRVAGKWAVANWRLGAHDENISLQITNDDLLEPKTALEWPRPGTDGMTNIRLAKSGLTELPYNPAKNYAMMIPAHDRKTLFVYQPAEYLYIAVINVTTGKTHYIKRADAKRIPFNQEWGRNQLAAQQETYNQRGLAGKLRWTEGFPRYFPWVRGLYAGVNGTLVINRWSGDPENRALLMVVDTMGKDASLPYKAEHEERILAVINRGAYLSAIIGDEAAVLKVPLAEVDKTVKAYPMPEQD